MQFLKKQVFYYYLNQKIDDIPFTDLKEIRIDGEDYLIEFDDFAIGVQFF